MVKAGRRNQHGARGSDGIDSAKGAFLCPGFDDHRGETDQFVDMRGGDCLRVGRQRSIGREKLRVVSGAPALDGDQRVEQLSQTLRGRASSFGDGPQRRHGRLHPAFHDELPKVGFVRHVPVDRRVRYSKRARDVDHGCPGGAESANDVFGRGQNPLPCERGVVSGH